MNKQPRTVLSGVLIILGIGYMLVGISWTALPTPSRLAGIEWLPFDVTEHTIGFVWLAGGAASAVGGMCQRFKVVENAGVMASVLAPIVCAAPFVGAFFESGDSRRLVTVISYLVWAAIAAWVASRKTVTLPPRGDKTK